MLGLVIVVIADIVAVDTDNVAGIALHTSLQTKHFVEQWHILIN